VTRSNKILLSVVALGAAIAAFYFVVLSPKREELAKLDSDIAAQETAVEQARLTLAGYEQAKKTYKKNYATLARLGKAVPTDDDVTSMMVQLEGTADRSGVNFEKIELGSGLGGATTATAATPADGQLASAPGSVPVAGGVLSAMPFSFSFTGSYFDLSAFFARLERFVAEKNQKLDSTGRLLRLETVTIAPSAAGFPNMQAQITAASYIVPPVQGVGESAAPSGAQNVGTTPGSTPPTSTPPTTTASATTGATP
jgi:Tfp pilus assembly protein PilO